MVQSKQSVNNDEKDEQSIENFLYFVGISLAISIIPIFENVTNNIWIKTISGFVIAFITIFLIKQLRNT